MLGGIWFIAVVAVFLLLMGLSCAVNALWTRSVKPRGKFFEADGVRIHYEVRGQGEAVVLVHGSEGCLQDFDPLVEAMDGRFMTVAFDRPGHGFSRSRMKRPWSIDSQTRALKALLDSLEINKATVVGHSWGACVALNFAQRFPARCTKVVTIAGWMFPDPPRDPLIYVPATPLLGWLMAATFLIAFKKVLVRTYMRTAFYPLAVDLEYEQLAMRLWQRYPWQTVDFARENVSVQDELSRAQGRYGRIECPVIAIIGDMDREVDHDLHSRHLTTAEVVTIPGAGHEIERTHPEAVIEALERTPVATPLQKNHLIEQLREFGACSVCWQGSNTSMEQAEVGGAEIAGVSARRLWVTAGEPSTRDPVGTARAFEQMRGRVCWFHVSDWYSAALSNDGSHERMLIGCEPIWIPSRWEEKLKGHASVRSQIRRAKKKGVVCEETHDMTGLSECQATWLKRHPLPPLSFLTEPSDLENIGERRIFTAVREGRVEGFLVAAPIPAIRGWLVEQVARMPDAPNGTTEALIDSAMRTLADEGANMLTLGLAPLSSRCGVERPASRAVGRLMRWSRAHGMRFYNFDGVEHFKAKLRPDEWRPVYAVVPGKWSVRDLAGVLEAFTKRRPVAALAEMVGPAIVQEAMWIFRGRK